MVAAGATKKVTKKAAKKMKDQKGAWEADAKAFVEGLKAGKEMIAANAGWGEFRVGSSKASGLGSAFSLRPQIPPSSGQTELKWKAGPIAMSSASVRRPNMGPTVIRNQSRSPVRTRLPSSSTTSGSHAIPTPVSRTRSAT